MSNFTLPADQALQRLVEGNKRFTAGLRSVDTIASVRALPELAARGQKPFAAALACADSRVPTEIIFDCGLGDLFVTRLAGNLVTPHILASLEFAAQELGVSLIFVLGHTSCGAVKAALSASNDSLTPSLKVLVRDLGPAVTSAKTVAGSSPEKLEHTVAYENVRLGCESLLERSEALSSLNDAGKIKIVGGVFDVYTGKVQFGVEKALPAAVKS
jgi:carbonic anhydrase